MSAAENASASAVPITCARDKPLQVAHPVDNAVIFFIHELHVPVGLFIFPLHKRTQDVNMPFAHKLHIFETTLSTQSKMLTAKAYDMGKLRPCN